MLHELCFTKRSETSILIINRLFAPLRLIVYSWGSFLQWQQIFPNWEDFEPSWLRDFHLVSTYIQITIQRQVGVPNGFL